MFPFASDSKWGILHEIIELTNGLLREECDVHWCFFLLKTYLFPFSLHQTLEEEFAREEREQQLFYARNSTEYPISPAMSIKESEEEPGEMIQVDGEKTPEDISSKSSSAGSMEV